MTTMTKTATSVYSGKAGKCCCGCAGKHYYASASRDEAGSDRGYPVRDEEVSDRMVSRVLKILEETPGVEHEDEFDSVVIGNRLYVAYYAAKAVR